MAQNFWAAIFAWTTCFLATIAVSLFTAPEAEEKLVGLVYSLTPRPEAEDLAWYKRPAALGVAVLVATLILNILFR
jgi:SSS family solute:Na+ symporter